MMANEKGRRESAIRKALKKFDKWVDVTGVVGMHTSYYYEMQGIIEDAVKLGIEYAARESEDKTNRIIELEKQVGRLRGSESKKKGYICYSVSVGDKDEKRA